MTSSEQRLQPLTPRAQESTGALDRPHRGFEFRGPFFRTDEAAIYLGYRGRHQLRSLYRFIEQQGIPTARRCRTLLIKKADLDRAIGAGHRRVS